MNAAARRQTRGVGSKGVCVQNSGAQCNPFKTIGAKWLGTLHSFHVWVAQSKSVDIESQLRIERVSLRTVGWHFLARRRIMSVRVRPPLDGLAL
jgi:hypothetical protein